MHTEARNAAKMQILIRNPRESNPRMNIGQLFELWI
jgi:hypothetical protein